MRRVRFFARALVPAFPVGVSGHAVRDALLRCSLVAAIALFGVQSAAGAACSWKLITSPNSGTNDNLEGVAGSSTQDVWAVGKYYNSSPVSLTLAEHWTGTAWSIVPTPNPSIYGNNLVGIADLSPTDAWAVGSQTDSTGNVHALILHWNGSKWSEVTAPPLKGQYPQLFGVTALSKNNIWAVGRSYNSSGFPAPYFLHWLGTKWLFVPSVNPGTFGSTLGALAAIAPTDVWATGGTYTNSGRTSLVTLAEHWNGSRWSVVKTPNANTNDNLFNGAVAVASNDVWAVGDYYTGSIFKTLTERWNGTAWSIVKSPNVTKFGDYLTAAAALSKTSVWAVGSAFTGPGSSGGKTFSIKWNGTKWLVPSSPNLPGGNPDLFTDAAAIPGSTTLWGVGLSLFPSNGNADQTLTASNACATLDLGYPGDDDAITMPLQTRQPWWMIRNPRTRL